jgi:hypothetical protein
MRFIQLDFNYTYSTSYYTLPEDKKMALQWWIFGYIYPYNLWEYTSDGFREEFMRSMNGFPVTDEQFKGAMLMAGYEPLNPYASCWIFTRKLTRA